MVSSRVTTDVLHAGYYVPDHRDNLEMQCVIRRIAVVRRRLARKRVWAARVILRAMRRWVGISRMMNPDTPEGSLHMLITARKWERQLRLSLTNIHPRDVST